MENKAQPITIEATVNAPVEKVWKTWSTPSDITKWCSPSDDWHAPKADNDLRAGGAFTTRMEAKDGSIGFDWGGVYDEVETNKVIAYTMSDGRKCRITFTADGSNTKIVETFDPENQNPLDMQRDGWQAILNSFKKYAEEN